MGGGKGALANMLGASSARLFDNAAAAEGNKTLGGGASSGRPGAHSILPECSEARDETGDLATSAALKRFENLAGCAARETSCLRCKKPKLRLGTTGSRFRVRSRLLRMSA